MARVYLAQDARGQRVALKMLHDRATPRHAERLVREGRLIATLDHPNVVRLISSGTFGGRPYLAYQVIQDAQELDAALAARSRTERIELLLGVAAGVAHAHEKGIAHRDLKPANVLVDPSGQPYVTDFGIGLSDDLEKMTKTGALIGTPSWMAPEQVRGKRDLQGPCSDVWALGVMLYEALTDTLPFVGESLVQISAKIVHEPPPSPRSVDPTISPELEAVCLRALTKDPSARFPDASRFAGALESALAGASSSGCLWKGLLVSSFVLLGLLGISLGVAGLSPSAPSATPRSPAPTPSPESSRAPIVDPAYRARALAQRAVELHPEDAAAWLELGDLDRDTRPAEAIKSYERAISIEPTPAAYIGLGFAIHRTGESKAGLKALAVGLDMQPLNPEAHAKLALIQFERGKLNRALSAATYALDLNSKHAGAWNTKGITLQALKKLPEAEECLRRSLELERAAGVLKNLGSVMSERGNPEGAVRSLREAIELDPDSANLWETLGVVQLEGKDPERAIVALTRALKLDANSAKACFYRALAQRRAGRDALALEDLERYLARASETDPLRADALEAVARLKAAER